MKEDISLQNINPENISANVDNSLGLDKDIVGDNERFEIEWIHEDLFSLKANNGFYISVQKDGKIEVNQKEINLSEQFSMIEKKEENLFEFLGFVNFK